MTLWWIGDIVLLVVVVPVVVYLLHGVLSAARSIVPARTTNRMSSQGIAVKGIVSPIATIAQPWPAWPPVAAALPPWPSP